MLEAFIIVLREGFESFLIVAITSAYLIRTGKKDLIRAVYAGVAISVISSAAFGYLMSRTSNEPLWEAVMGLISGVLILAFVIHMWISAPKLKQEMECQLSAHTHKSSSQAWWGIFAFTVVMITREGMETALLLLQVHSSEVVKGAVAGGVGAVCMALLWNRLGKYINLKAFLQVTAVYLILFVIQIFVHTFHEFTETGLLPNSDYWHVATEPFSSEGIYGKAYSTVMIALCGAWLVGQAIYDKFFKKKSETNR